MAVVLSPGPARAQRGGSPGGGAGGGTGGSRGGAPAGGAGSRPIYVPTQPGTQPNEQPYEIAPQPDPAVKPKPVMPQDDACLPWDLSNVHDGSVSAIRLGVPSKARSQYEKACGLLKKNKVDEAEQHVRDAIEKYPSYPAAWVMLGQLLASQQKLDEAQDACSHPMKADPTYLPPYLCLAGLLDREKHWDDLVNLSDRFRGLNLGGDMYSNYYRGLSLFHLGKLPEAQKSVMDAINLDSEHHQPGLNFLLAQIYGEQGDVAGASVQVQQFVKYAKNQQDKDSAKEYLSELQARQNLK